MKEILGQKLIYLRELFFGRTKKQTRPDKPSFIGKSMLGMYGLFTIYSFILFALMNTKNIQNSVFLLVLKILCFGDPYAFGIALSFALFILSLVFCNEKILVWTYTKYRYPKQILIFFAATGVFFALAKYLVFMRVDLYSVLLVFAMIWLVFQSVRIYSAALNGATKLEIQMSSRYSPIRYMIAYITPFIILGVITVVAWIFRYFIVIFTLDFIGHPDKDPVAALAIYRKEMEIIMPMIYTGLLCIFILMITQIILSKKKGSTARAGTFDNLVFGVISMVMFFYSIYNIALYLFLDETFLSGFSLTALNQEPGNETGFFFLFEFLIALVFFLWIVLDLTNIFGDKGFLFFNKDGFVIFLMSTLIAQTTARLGLVTGESFVNTTFSDFIKYDYVVLPWLILLFLGVTIVIYWIKPQQVSVFLRSGKSAREGDDQSMQRILKFLKREFIRRGEKYIISPDLTKALRDMTGLSIGTVWSLIYRLNDSYIDVQLLEAKDERGEKIVLFDFLPITATEKYQKGKDADVRAKQYLQNLLIENISNVPKKMYIPKKTQSSSSQKDLFIQALSVQYSRKIEDDAKKTAEEENIIINQAVDEHTKEIVYGILQTECIQRISQVADYRDNFNFRISDVADRIARVTKLPIARIYKLIYEMAGPNWNFSLTSNLVNKASEEDKLIELIPIDDWTVYEALVKHRPTHLKPIRVYMQKLFYNNIKYKRSKLEHLPPLVYSDENLEFQRSYISRWWANTMQYFGKYFIEYQQHLNPNYLSSKFDASIKLVIKTKMQEYLEQHARDNKPAYSPK